MTSHRHRFDRLDGEPLEENGGSVSHPEDAEVKKESTASHQSAAHSDPPEDATSTTAAGEKSKIIDRWQLIEEIGTGGMSVVYKARHLVLGKMAAVKLMLPHLTQNQQSLRRFQQEAKAASVLNHKNVLSIYDCGVTPDGEAYIIMDYLQGKSLADIIADEGPLEPDRALLIFNQVAEGLSHAHSHGIVHRDLKPSNLMIVKSEDGSPEVKIVDFGIAKLLSGTEEVGQGLTKTGDVFGSPLYMSPEQCQGRTSDMRTDIYSMGCLMYEALCGHPPFVGINALDTMHKQINENPHPLAREDTDDSTFKRLSQIIDKCLEKAAKDRYQSVGELSSELAAALTFGEQKWRASSKAAQSASVRKAKGSALALLLNLWRRHWRLIAGSVATASMLSIAALSWFVAYSPSFKNYKSHKLERLWDLEAPPPVKEMADFTKREAAMLMALEKLSTFQPERQIDKLMTLQEAAEFYEANGHWLEAARRYEEQSDNKITDLTQARTRARAARCYYYGARSSVQPKHYYALAQADLLGSINYIVDHFEALKVINSSGQSIEYDVYKIPDQLLKGGQPAADLCPPLETQEWLYEEAVAEENDLTSNPGDGNTPPATTVDTNNKSMEAIKKCEQIVKAAHTTGDAGLKGKYLCRKGELLRYLGAKWNMKNDTHQAREDYQEALRLSGALPYPLDQAKARYGFGLATLDLVESVPDQRRYYAREAASQLNQAVSAMKEVCRRSAGMSDHQLLACMQKDYADALWAADDYQHAIWERFVAACMLFSK